MGRYRGFHKRQPRKLSDLLIGLIAVMMVVVSMPLLTFVWFREGGLVQRYRTAATRAFESKDYERAALAFDRLVRIEPVDPERYNLALSLLETGNRKRGANLMQRLAPADAGGYGPAHIWQARELLEQTKQEPDLDRVLMATNHLLKVKNTKYNDGEIDILLADCYWRSGSIVKSLESLRDAALLDPQYYYELFLTCREVGQIAAANQAAARASQYYKDRVAGEPLDRLARVRYAELLTWLNAFEMAHAILQQGIYVDPEGNWKKAVADSYLARFRQGKSDGETPDRLLTYLERAFDADPESTDVLRQLTSFGIDDDSGRIDKILEAALTRGTHNAMVHFVMGTRLWQRDRFEDGAFHMRRAYALNSKLAFAANNMAYLELLDEDGDLEQGLAIINDVLEKFPDVHAFRETRGQLLTKLKRWEDALNDLEYALPNFPDERMLHASLADCYRNLGQESMADRHAEIAEKLPESVTKVPELDD